MVVRMSRDGRPASLVAALVGDVNLDGAACAGAFAGGAEFVDPDPGDVELLIRAYCHRCVVVGRCREYGDSLAPHKVPSIYGARFYGKAEPLDGWEVAS
jgi:hypothetical protein